MRSAARPSVAPAATAKAASRNPSVAQSQQTIPLFDQDDHPSVPTWLTRQTPFDPDYPVKQHEVRAAGRCACTYSHSVPVTEHWGRSGGTQVWRCIPAAAHRFRTLPPAPRNGDPPPMVKGFWRGGNPAGAIGQLEAPDRFWQRHFCHQDAFLIPDRFQQLHTYMRIGEFEPEHRTEECHSSTPPRSRFSALPLIRPAFAAARSIS